MSRIIEGDDWQPISTAPRDGSIIEIGAEDAGRFPMRWNPHGRNEVFQPDAYGIWEAPDGSLTWSESLGAGPTHWRPLKPALQ